jgi:hypothetical protein
MILFTVLPRSGEPGLALRCSARQAAEILCACFTALNANFGHARQPESEDRDRSRAATIANPVARTSTQAMCRVSARTFGFALTTSTPRKEQAGNAISSQTWRSPDVWSRFATGELNHVDDEPG